LSRRQKGRPVHGVVLLDKPPGRSSNQAMQAVRRLFDARKAGHTGNLDPFATGMLPVCLGEATKTAAFMLDADKTYRAVARLGQATTTGDPEGEVIQEQEVPALAAAQVEGVLAGFLGEISQLPPMYSALKHQGQPLYSYARRGITIERPRRTVTIHALRLLNWRAPELEFEVSCSKGTYVRTLAEDIAAAMGSCAHLRTLRRTFVSSFEGQSLVRLEELEAAQAQGTLEQYLLPVDAGLVGWPLVTLSDADAAGFRNGNPCQVQAPAGWLRVYDPAGILLGLAECREGQLLPRRVMPMNGPPPS
jgi:tRNA pseudouridine55 synthase